MVCWAHLFEIPGWEKWWLLYVSTGSARAALLGWLHCHHQEWRVPWTLGFVSLQLYSKIILPAFTTFEETVCFSCYRLLTDCKRRKENRAPVTLSWIRTNNVYCTKGLQTSWGCSPCNLPLVFICVFWLKRKLDFASSRFLQKCVKHAYNIILCVGKMCPKGWFHHADLIILDRKACLWQVCIFLDILLLILSAVFSFLKWNSEGFERLFFIMLNIEHPYVAFLWNL